MKLWIVKSSYMKKDKTVDDFHLFHLRANALAWCEERCEFTKLKGIEILPVKVREMKLELDPYWKPIPLKVQRIFDN